MRASSLNTLQKYEILYQIVCVITRFFLKYILYKYVFFYKNTVPVKASYCNIFHQYKFIYKVYYITTDLFTKLFNYCMLNAK